MKSFLEALQAKYAPPEEEEDTSLSFGGGQIQVETVGWSKVGAKQKMLGRLRDVGLAEEDITMAVREGESASIDQVCPAIEDLDLSKNPLPSWQVVADIVRALPRLTSLRLNQTSIPSLTERDTTLDDAFVRLTKLSLVGADPFPWHAWPTLFASFTKLESLFLTRTVGASLVPMADALPTLFPNLQILGLEQSGLTEWEHIEPLGALPALQTLFLQDNALTHVRPQKGHWAALTTLNITNNQIAQWTDVHALNHFPALQEVRLRHNPVLKDVPADDLHALLIARIGKIQTLHGTSISERDRRDSELHYLKHATREMTDLTNTAFAQKHPRYQELIDVHGEPTLTQSDVTGATLKDTLVSLTLSWEAGQKRLVKKLPLNVTVRNLRTMVHRLFGLGDASFGLKVKYTASGFEQEMDDDMKELKYYALSENDEIMVFNTG